MSANTFTLEAAAAHPELHPCAAPYNKSRSIPAKRLWKHSGYFLKKRLVTTNICNGFNGAAHPLCGNKPWGGLFVFVCGIP